MRLADMVDALPESWVVRGNCRAQKRPVLDAYEVGIMCVKAMMLPYAYFTEAQIVEIGNSSIRRKHVLVTKAGKEWTVVPCTAVSCRNGGYIVKGKKVIPLQQHRKGTLKQLMEDFECGDGRRLDGLDAEGLFHAFQGKRTHKGHKKGGESSMHHACKNVCPVQDCTRPWKRGERVHMRTENRKRREAEDMERYVIGVMRIAKSGLMYRPNPKATHSNCTGRNII